jgi:peptide-methionine (R)-S-oxide reductase
MLKKIFIPIILSICYCCNSQKKTINKPSSIIEKTQFKIEKSEEQWKKDLTAMEFYILRQAGTERAFSGKYDKHFKPGLYVCSACDNPLYDSKFKYDSKSGWPSFDRGINNNIILDIDYNLGYPRTELKCKSCGGHLGHLFTDGPKSTTGNRHCVNSVALKFIPKKNEL